MRYSRILQWTLWFRLGASLPSSGSGRSSSGVAIAERSDASLLGQEDSHTGLFNASDSASNSTSNRIETITFNRNGYTFKCGYDAARDVRPDQPSLSSAIRWFIDDQVRLFDQTTSIGRNSIDAPAGRLYYAVAWHKTLTWGEIARILGSLGDEAAARGLNGFIYASVSPAGRLADQTLEFNLRQPPNDIVSVSASVGTTYVCDWKGQIYSDQELISYQARAAVQSAITWAVRHGNHPISEGERKFFLNGQARLEYRIQQMAGRPTFDFTYDNLQSVLLALQQFFRERRRDQWKEFYGIITRGDAVAGYLTISANQLLPSDASLTDGSPTNSTDLQTFF